MFDRLELFPYLTLAQTALTIWMLVDAYRRQADTFWFWVILLLQPVGAWVYFFAVKSGDFGGLKGLTLFQRRVSLDELRYRATQTPTLVNHLTLAERLMERGVHGEALPHLQSALSLEPDHCQVLYCLAKCHAEQGHPEQAQPFLEKILSHDRRWSNYAAWHLLATVREQTGDGEGALKTCRELVRLAPTLQHRCLLAERLLEEGLTEEARTLLQQALDDHRFAPSAIRKRNRHWASVARRLQKRL
jgi:hypothetical protein